MNIPKRLNISNHVATATCGGNVVFFGSPRRAHLMLSLFFFLLICSSSFGQQWSLVGGGLNNDPSKLYYDAATDQLIVGGSFRKADDKWITGIGSWDGSNWDSLGHGLNFFDTLGNPANPSCNVWTMERYNGYLYCGGGFVKAGYDSMYSFARWDGSTWDTVPGGTLSAYKPVNDIIVWGNDMYICGGFDSIGNTPADGLAKWDGANWSAIGPNYDFINPASSGLLLKMKIYHGNLYVAGRFDDPNGNFCRLAKWDGTAWTYFTNDLVGGLAFISDLEVYNDELYVGGLFYSSVGNAATSIMRWNDTTWSDVGGSIEIGATNPYPTVCDMEVHNGKLYCVGNFEIVGGIHAAHIASWDGTNWCGYGSVFDNKITQIAFYNDTMYVSGGFWTIDGDSINFIAKWISGAFVDTCGNATGIFDHAAPLSNVSVFPNPSNTFTTFSFSGISSTRTVIITDNLGREIYRKQTSESTLEFPASEYTTGMYFYRVEEENEISAAGKFIISR